MPHVSTDWADVESCHEYLSDDIASISALITGDSTIVLGDMKCAVGAGDGLRWGQFHMKQQSNKAGRSIRAIASTHDMWSHTGRSREGLRHSYESRNAAHKTDPDLVLSRGWGVNLLRLNALVRIYPIISWSCLTSNLTLFEFRLAHRSVRNNSTSRNCAPLIVLPMNLRRYRPRKSVR